MFAFVARQPILNREKEVFGYELLFRDGASNTFPELDANKAKLIPADHHSLSLDDISCEKTSFINFHKDTLVNRFPTNLDPTNIVVEVLGEQTRNNGLVEACKYIKTMGFTLAMDESSLMPNIQELGQSVDIVKLDTSKHDIEHLNAIIPMLRQEDVQLIAGRVNSNKAYELYYDMGFDFFQGYFFSRPESIHDTELPSSKMSMLDLINESSQENFNLDKVNDIMELDVGLSYMLLRFINNPTVNKRYKITSLRHALNYMGEVEIKKFIALLALANLGDAKPIEILHMSLVRARFCDLVSQVKKVGDNPPTAFMTGLFSLLDALLDQSMADALAKIPIADDVKLALSGGRNELAHYLALAKAFESANWMKVIRLADILKIDQKTLHSLFNQAIVWGNGIRKSVSPHFPAKSA